VRSRSKEADQPAPEALKPAEAGLGPVLGPVFLITCIFFIGFLARTIVAPMLPSVERDLGLGHDQSGSLFLLLSLGYVTSLLGSGLVSARLNHRRTIILSTLTVGATLLIVGLSRSLTGLRLGMLATGLAAGLYLPSGVAALTGLVSPRHWGKALAIHEMAPNLGFVAAPLIAEVLLAWLSWRQVVLTTALASALSGLAFARYGCGGESRGQSPNLWALRDLTRLPDFWIMSALFGLGIGASLGIYTMLPLYLVSAHGLERPEANLLVSLSRISGIGMAFAGGWANDRLGPRRVMAWALGVSGVLTVLLGLASGAWLKVMIFVQPALIACFFPSAFATMSQLGSARSRSLAVSLSLAAAIILGGGLIPAGMGWLGELGFFGAGLVAIGGLALVSLALVPRLDASVSSPDG